MKGKALTARQAIRRRKSFPVGTYTALLTSALVTLVGVFLRLDPFTILSRAVGSALLLGLVVSIGVSVIRLADSGYKR
jgi:hypothetical protein